ncbi:prim-pol domain-containing protein, partial [Atractiella rhizophila]
MIITLLKSCELFTSICFRLNNFSNGSDHSSSPSRLWTHREFAFTLPSDAYIRFNSFNVWQDLQNEIFRLNPSRFEIGAVYSHRPRDKKSLSAAMFKPQLRELVFDIDMTDYDDIRTCCSDKRICRRCWKFIACGVKVIDRILREDFGFQHLLYVYSGRRGIHLWVSDAEAMALSDDARRALVNYIDIIKGGQHQDKKVNLSRPLHPSLQSSFDSLKSSFTSIILTDQDTFSNPAKAELLLRLIPNSKLTESVRKEWGKYKNLNSVERWGVLQKERAHIAKKDNDTVTAAIDDIIFQFTYPRIDAEVSKHQNHLLKSPFCVHPGTGRVCIPVDIDKIDDFDPDAVPTVSRLLYEFEAAQKKVKGEAEDVETSASMAAKSNGWEHTALKPYIEMFERHIAKITREYRLEKKGPFFHFFFLCLI